MGLGSMFKGINKAVKGVGSGVNKVVTAGKAKKNMKGGIGPSNEVMSKLGGALKRK